MTINDTTMTSGQNPHAAWHAPERNGWKVSWLYGQILDRNTAMILAGTAAARDLHEGRRLWPYIQDRAAELGLTAPDAITRTSEPPEKTSTQEPATSRADPEAQP